MSPLEANLAALDAHHPELAALARTAPRAELVVEGGLQLTDRGRSLEWYRPSVPAAAAAATEKKEVRRARLLAVFGLGLGHELRAALAHRAHRTLLVVEPDPDVFRAAVRAVDLSDLFAHPHARWLVGLELEILRLRLHEELSHARFLFFARSVGLLISEGAQRFHGPRVTEAVKLFRTALVSSLALSGNDPRDTLLGLENIHGNLARVVARPSVWALEGALRGRPAIVASTGPSLKQALPLLREVEDQIPIFCPDTSIRVLLEAGIRPHVAASRERVEKTTKHFEGIDTTEIALACCPVLNPRIFELHRGPVAYIYRSVDFHAWLRPDGPTFEFDGSAGNLAYRLAALSGCDPIILVGQDLCFGENGDTHAEGTATGARQPNFKKKAGMQVPGARGGLVDTTKKWLGFLRRFELDIQALGPRVVNATAHGAHIAGTEVMELEAALASLAPGDDPRPEILRALEPRPREAQAEHRARLAAQLTRTRTALESIREVGAIGQAFPAQCKKSFAKPAAKAPDLDLLLREKPYLTLDGVRQKLMKTENEVFQSYLQPVVQPTMIAIEMERYAAELSASSPAELGKAWIAQYGQWFRDIDALAARAEALLELGERSLGLGAPSHRETMRSMAAKSSGQESA